MSESNIGICLSLSLTRRYRTFEMDNFFTNNNNSLQELLLTTTLEWPATVTALCSAKSNIS